MGNTPGSTDEKSVLQQFEDSHRQLHAQIDAFMASINQLYTDAQAYSQHVNIDHILKQVDAWRVYFAGWEPVAQQMASQGHPSLLERLRNVQQEFSKWNPGLWQTFNEKRMAIHEAQLKAQRDWFEQVQENHRKMQEAFDAANDAWLKKFMGKH